MFFLVVAVCVFVLVRLGVVARVGKRERAVCVCVCCDNGSPRKRQASRCTAPPNARKKKTHPPRPPLPTTQDKWCRADKNASSGTANADSTSSGLGTGAKSAGTVATTGVTDNKCFDKNGGSRATTYF